MCLICTSVPMMLRCSGRKSYASIRRGMCARVRLTALWQETGSRSALEMTYPVPTTTPRSLRKMNNTRAKSRQKVNAASARACSYNTTTPSAPHLSFPTTPLRPSSQPSRSITLRIADHTFSSSTPSPPRHALHRRLLLRRHQIRNRPRLRRRGEDESVSLSEL